MVRYQTENVHGRHNISDQVDTLLLRPTTDKHEQVRVRVLSDASPLRGKGEIIHVSRVQVELVLRTEHRGIQNVVDDVVQQVRLDLDEVWLAKMKTSTGSARSPDGYSRSLTLGITLIQSMSVIGLPIKLNTTLRPPISTLSLQSMISHLR